MNANDEMFCQICTQPIPEKRRTRATSVCSEKCKDKLDAIRARQRAVRKCTLCLHPSTPEERAEFRQWRYERGDLKSAKVIVRDYTMANKTDLVNRLKSVRLLLQHELDLITGPNVRETVEDTELAATLREKAEKFAKQIREIDALVEKRSD